MFSDEFVDDPFLSENFIERAAPTPATSESSSNPPSILIGEPGIKIRKYLAPFEHRRRRRRRTYDVHDVITYLENPNVRTMGEGWQRSHVNSLPPIYSAFDDDDNGNNTYVHIRLQPRTCESYTT